MIAVLILLGCVALSLFSPGSSAPVPQQATFLGFTHAVPGGLTNAFGTNAAAFLREWSAAGTNVALFSVTNQQRYPIILFPQAGFFNATNAAQPRYDTLLLNATAGRGVFLQPGQAATLEVAVLPGQSAGWVRFGYTPDYKRFSAQTFEVVRGLATRAPVGFRTEWFFSERIAP